MGLRCGTVGAATLRRLPELAQKVEDITDETSASGFRLHTDTVDDLARRLAEIGSRATTALWAAAWLALLVAAIALIV
ncbi:MAG: hypothetical protein GDA49_11680 [Rhodospirillales bacterium]|nr:hypothetical protein [Rhodospirillales bacterium]